MDNLLQINKEVGKDVTVGEFSRKCAEFTLKEIN